MGDNRKKSRIWSFFDDLKGDKVVWMIVLLLMLYSVVSLFSASSCDPKVISGKISRIDAMKSELLVILSGLVVVVLIYHVVSLKVIRIVGRAGFLLSFMMLLFVNLKMSFGPFRAAQINSAWRIISLAGFQIHIYELIKVLMVLYLAYILDAYKKKDIRIANKLGRIKRLSFLNKEIYQSVIFIYAPMFIVFVMIATQGFSSSAIVAAVMYLTILVSGVEKKRILWIGAVLAALAVGLYGLWKSTGWEVLDRMETVESRLEGLGPKEERFLNAKRGTAEYFDALDAIRQQEAAIVAVKEGGLLGKGPGNSVQKYQVSMMFEDFMFSLLVEEYGIILGGVFIIMLYLSLLARGNIIARNCNDRFAKVTVAGLVLLISLQAFMHICVNLAIGPMTGQTLPLISHGKSSFLAFCAAFGIILSISRMTTKRIEKEMKYMNAENPIIVRPEDDGIQSELNTLDMLDSEEMMGDETTGNLT